MDVVIEKASEELVLLPEQTNLSCNYANRGIKLHIKETWFKFLGYNN